MVLGIVFAVLVAAFMGFEIFAFVRDIKKAKDKKKEERVDYEEEE